MEEGISGSTALAHVEQQPQQPRRAEGLGGGRGTLLRAPLMLSGCKAQPFFKFPYSLLEPRPVSGIGCIAAARTDLRPIEIDCSLHPFASCFVAVPLQQKRDPLRFGPDVGQGNQWPRPRCQMGR